MKRWACSLAVALLAACCAGAAAQALDGNEPAVGQPGKDVVWVPSPRSVVEKMLTMAEVTPTSEMIHKLQPKLLALRPGTRIVSNSFPALDWEPDATTEEPLMGDCDIWCSALLWIVPARVAGTYETPHGHVMLNQKNQILSGVLRSGGRTLELEGRVRGEEIAFRAGRREYRGRLVGGRLELM